jgi:hypothetical protein
MIVQAFPNVGTKVAEDFVAGMMDPQKDQQLFKTHVRDFLVRIREFSAGQVQDGQPAGLEELYVHDREEEQRRIKEQTLRERAAIPGMLTQQERDEMADL